MVSLDFRIEKLRVLKVYGEYRDVVAEARIKVVGSKDGLAGQYEKLWVVHFDLSKIVDFKRLEDLTKDDIIGWVTGGEEGEERVEKLRGEFEEMFSPPDYYYKPTFAGQ